MKAVIQRVNYASVTVKGHKVAQIDRGLLVFLGIKKGDTAKERDYVIKKLLNLRIFPDKDQSFDKTVLNEGFDILLVSQFTLYADCSKGNRPSFYNAMPPQEAKKAYEAFADELKRLYPQLQEGIFGAQMQIELINDGPVTILIEC